MSHRRGGRCQCGDTRQRGNVTHASSGLTAPRSASSGPTTPRSASPGPTTPPMTDSDWLAGAFEEHRDHLRAVAYRLLGSMSDADDAVQDTWLRVTSANASEVENLGGWLTTVVARVSLNMLRSRRRRPEQPVGDSWPAPARRLPGMARRPGRRGGPAAPHRWAIRRTRPCSRTRSASPCWSCWTRSPPPNGSRSSCTTCSTCRSPRWRTCSAAPRTPRGSSRAGPGAGSAARQARTMPPTSPASGR